MKTKLCIRFWDLIHEVKDVDITLNGLKSYRFTLSCNGGVNFPCGIRVIPLFNQIPINRTKYFQGEFMKFQFFRWCMARLSQKDLRTLISALEDLNPRD
jgi:hypothetical protein